MKDNMETCVVRDRLIRFFSSNPLYIDVIKEEKRLKKQHGELCDNLADR
jgi:hypothetical protein